MNKVFLFPHCALSREELEKIPRSLKPIIICKPWYMDVKEEELNMEILFPDEELRPPEDFLKILNEYKLWMRGQDKGNALFMILEREIWGSDESPRKIKRLIKNGGEKGLNSGKLHDSIKWHLILHLASEFELSQWKIDSEIEKLGKKGSPLKGIVEGEAMSLSSLFNDVTSSRIDPILGERTSKEIIKAWIGLFGKFLDQDTILLTLSKNIFDLLKGVFEDVITRDIYQKEDLPVKYEKINGTSMLHLSFPLLLEKKTDIEDFLAGKKLIYLRMNE